jgi:hypothetical protein
VNSETSPIEPFLAAEIPSSPVSINLEKIAHLVASGQMPLPEELSPEELQEVVHQVRTRCRQRLLKLIASAIAQDLMQSIPARDGVFEYGQTQD